jgi:hypothetical protein
MSHSNSLHTEAIVDLCFNRLADVHGDMLSMCVSGCPCSHEIRTTYSRCSEVRSHHLPLCCWRRFYGVIPDGRSHARTAPKEPRARHQRRRGQMCSVAPKVRPHVQRPEERVGVHCSEAVSHIVSVTDKDSDRRTPNEHVVARHP